MEILNFLQPTRLPGEVRPYGGRPPADRFDELVETAEGRNAPRVVRELPLQAPAGDQFDYAELLRQARMQRVGAVESRELPPLQAEPRRSERALAAYREQLRIAETSPGSGELVGVDYYV